MESVLECAIEKQKAEKYKRQGTLEQLERNNFKEQFEIRR